MRPVVTILCLLLAGLFSTASNAEEDPWESFNRSIYSFNNTADAYLVKPVAQGYAYIMPEVGRKGVNNFFNNLLDVNGALNGLLQGRVDQGLENVGRVIINSTIGIFGLFDVATKLGVPQYQTDFGHTLSIWGVPQGPFVMLPFLGPSTMRSGVGTAFDAYASPMGQMGNSDPAWGLRVFNIVDLRAGLLGADELLSGDQYIFLRDAYLQQRRLQISDGKLVDDFSEFDDGWEEDDL
ncbi:MAG: VacJ family lipoprotein [Halieaceae bacterium]|jgi:phospholipid-binding lipoprotein MlaA